MRAVWITKAGGPEVLEVREAQDLVAKTGELRIRTGACGMNFAELMARQGLYPDAPKLPCIVGYEAAGTVDSVGEGVDRWARQESASWYWRASVRMPTRSAFHIKMHSRFPMR